MEITQKKFPIQVDFRNEFFNELQKFAWLLQRGVITQEEYEAAKHQLMFAHAGWVTVEPQRLN